MHKISIQTKGYSLDTSIALLPALVIDKGRKSITFTFAWLKWALDLEFASDKPTK